MTQLDLGLEKQRRSRNKDRVLAALSSGRWLTNVELTEVGGMRFGGRIWELQQEGYRIAKEHRGGGVWAYRMEGAP